MGIEFRKAKILEFEMGLSQYEARKAVEVAPVEEEGKFIAVYAYR